MFYRTKLPEEKRKQEVVLGKLYDNYESEFPKLTTKPARISEEKPTQGVHKITRSQYKELTRLDTVVSSNFGIVVPDEPESDNEESYHPTKLGA